MITCTWRTCTWRTGYSTGISPKSLDWRPSVGPGTQGNSLAVSIESRTMQKGVGAELRETGGGRRERGKIWGLRCNYTFTFTHAIACKDTYLYTSPQTHVFIEMLLFITHCCVPTKQLKQGYMHQIHTDTDTQTSRSTLYFNGSPRCVQSMSNLGGDTLGLQI